MSYQPVSGIVPQYSDDFNQLASGFYLKFYIANTTTPLSMATDSSGGTLLVKAKLNPDGLPISNPLDNDTVFIPHVNQSYRLVIYRNETDANNDDTASAFLNVPSLEPLAPGSVSGGVIPYVFDSRDDEALGGQASNLLEAKLATGDYAYTAGKATPGDGEGQLYEIVDSGGSVTLDNGKQAKIVSKHLSATGTQTVAEGLDDRVVTINSIAEGVSTFASRTIKNGQGFRATGWQDGSDDGGHNLKYDSTWPKSEHGVTGWSHTVPAVSAQSGATLAERVDNYLSGAGETDVGGSGGFVIENLHYCPYLFGASASQNADVNLAALKKCVAAADGEKVEISQPGTLSVAVDSTNSIPVSGDLWFSTGKGAIDPTDAGTSWGLFAVDTDAAAGATINIELAQLKGAYANRLFTWTGTGVLERISLGYIETEGTRVMLSGVSVNNVDVGDLVLGTRAISAQINAGNFFSLIPNSNMECDFTFNTIKIYSKGVGNEFQLGRLNGPISGGTLFIECETNSGSSGFDLDGIGSRGMISNIIGINTDFEYKHSSTGKYDTARDISFGMISLKGGRYLTRSSCSVGSVVVEGGDLPLYAMAMSATDVNLGSDEVSIDIGSLHYIHTGEVAFNPMQIGLPNMTIGSLKVTRKIGDNAPVSIPDISLLLERRQGSHNLKIGQIYTEGVERLWQNVSDGGPKEKTEIGQIVNKVPSGLAVGSVTSYIGIDTESPDFKIGSLEMEGDETVYTRPIDVTVSPRFDLRRVSDYAAEQVWARTSAQGVGGLVNGAGYAGSTTDAAATYQIGNFIRVGSSLYFKAGAGTGTGTLFLLT